MEGSNVYDFVGNPAYAIGKESYSYIEPNLVNSPPRCNTKLEPPDSHYSSVKPIIPEEVKTPILSAKSNCNNSGIVTVVGLMMGFNFLLALGGVFIGTFAYLQSSGTSKEQPLLSYLSSTTNISSGEVFDLQESLTAMMEMIENMNKTMHSQLIATGLPGILYCVELHIYIILVRLPACHVSLSCEIQRTAELIGMKFIMGTWGRQGMGFFFCIILFQNSEVLPSYPAFSICALIISGPIFYVCV